MVSKRLASDDFSSAFYFLRPFGRHRSFSSVQMSLFFASVFFGDSVATASFLRRKFRSKSSAPQFFKRKSVLLTASLMARRRGRRRRGRRRRRRKKKKKRRRKRQRKRRRTQNRAKDEEGRKTLRLHFYIYKLPINRPCGRYVIICFTSTSTFGYYQYQYLGAPVGQQKNII